MDTAIPLDAGSLRRRDITTISTIGVAHGTSHFFHMLLPPLFPAFIQAFGLSYSELGLLVTTFFVISGAGQALAGFLVDRIGARPVLFAAMVCFFFASVAAGLAQGFGGLMLAAALAGVGNAPFHPADFTILNKRVSQPRLGHAFSVHGISGNLGWALAPVFSIGIAQATGNWRFAYVGTALVALAVMTLLFWQRSAIDDREGSWGHAKPAAGAKPEHPMAFLKLPSVWLCFSFFFWTTAALSAIQSFASPALHQIYGLPLALTAYVVTGYMLAGAAGMVCGGFLVARAERLERTIAYAMAFAAALLLLVASGWLPGALAASVAALAGFGTGLAGPSRDMLIKRASPPGATGRVYGTVYSGLDIGFAIAAPVFGAILDHGMPRGVFAGSAAALMLGIASAGLVGLGLSRRAAAAVPA
ncbi:MULTISPECIES: MFS transporter [unclassified Roseateles]|uniref:MFS transporter n=1 Tax=unclassified Roseateles TaxID=2626991 RepID=UPI000B1A3AB7|nr:MULTISPECIES: MFS transporter [unclassified Roseateles]